MNKYCILAWMDDWQMSARLAKLSTLHSYGLQFLDGENGVLNSASQILLIIDIDSINEDKFQGVHHLKEDKDIFILGYARELYKSQVTRFRELGYDMVLSRNKLLKNLGPVVKQIASVNAD